MARRSRPAAAVMVRSEPPRFRTSGDYCS